MKKQQCIELEALDKVVRKKEGRGSIHKYKYLQYKALKVKYPTFKKNIAFEENIALIKYFSRSLDFSIIGDFYASFFYVEQVKSKISKERVRKKLSKTY